MEALAIGLLLAGLASSLIFRTYAISMPSLGLELARQFGLIFLIAEIAVIGFALLRGLSPGRMFGQMDLASRLALTLFVGTFWIGGLIASPVPALAAIHQLSWVLHLLFGMAVVHCLNPPTEEGIANFGGILALSLLIAIPIIAMHFAFPPQGLGSPDERFGWGIAIPGYISGRLFGAFCGAVLALLVGIALGTSEGRAPPRWLYPAVLLVAGLVIWSGTRAAVLAVVGAGLVGLIICGVRPRRATIIRLGLCALLAALIAPLLIPYGDPYFLMFEAKDLASGNAVSGGRFGLWRTTLAIIADHPLFGAGDGALPWLVPDNVFPHVQPHNMVLQFLLSWGLAGTLPALFLLARASWRVHRIARARPMLLPMLMMLDALIVMGLLDGMFFFSQFLMLIALGYAVLLASAPRDTELWMSPSRARSLRTSPTAPA